MATTEVPKRPKLDDTTASKTIELPDEVIVEIFTYLTPAQLKTCCLVSVRRFAAQSTSYAFLT